MFCLGDGSFRYNCIHSIFEKIIENYIQNEEFEYDGDGSESYYLDWPLYQYHKSDGNATKAQQYLTDAYNHISEDERDEYLQDDKRLEHLYKYYYIHEIIEEYNQHIR